MRIIAGSFKGRRLKAPSWPGLRPTSDKLRETLFNVWGARAQGAHVLDAYAGTGAVGLEALSRGAASATFVERDPRAVRLVRENVAALGLESQTTVVQSAVEGFSPSREGRFDLVFADPPYDVTTLSDVLDRLASVTTPGGWVVVEHATRAPVPTCDRLQWVRSIRSGDSTLSVLTPMTPADASPPETIHD